MFKWVCSFFKKEPLKVIRTPTIQEYLDALELYHWEARYANNRDQKRAIQSKQQQLILEASQSDSKYRAYQAFRKWQNGEITALEWNAIVEGLLDGR